MALEFQKNGQTIVLRNLQEQVQKNKEDIAAHYAIDRAMANLGIKVVGQVTSPADLPDPLNYQGEYGDTYAVGDKAAVEAGTATYDYYVFTRPDLNAGQVNDYWINVGKISIRGPQGPEGPQGPKGDTGASTKWYAGSLDPADSSSYEDGDMYLQSNGDIWKYSGITNIWIKVANIKAPQGPQGQRGPQGPQGIQGPEGPQGPKGDPAYQTVIFGIVENTGQLPTPSSLNNLSGAYLVGTAQPYLLYIQVGKTPETAVWTSVGPLNSATLVYQNGSPVLTFNADNKLDKVTTASTYWRAYVVTSDQRQELKNLGPEAGAWSLVERNGDLQIIVPETPTSNDNATSKKYVDDNLNNKLDKVTTASTYWRAYVVKADGTQDMHAFGPNAGPWTLVERDGDSQIEVPETPTAAGVAASKAYVDKMTTGTVTIFTASSSVSTGAKNGDSFNCQGGTKGVYAVNTTQYVGIIVMTSTSSGLMYGNVLSAINSGTSIEGHKLM